MSRASISLIGVSAPTFWLAFIVLAVFYGGLQIAPGPGRLDPIAFPPTAITGLLPDRHRAAGRLGDVPRRRSRISCCRRSCSPRPRSGLITRTTRASMLESLQQDYVRVARAKGLRERLIVVGHALPNALIPVVTLGGLAYANLLTGAVMTETIFSWPGLGRYTFRSAVALDFPAIMGITLIVAIDLSARQSAGRHHLRAARSAGGAMTPRHRSRPAHRLAPSSGGAGCAATGWPAFGAAIILAWILVAIFAPLLTPLSLRTSST